MRPECKTMHELHAVRKRLNEATKDMSPEEQADFINKRADVTLAEVGLKLGVCNVAVQT